MLTLNMKMRVYVACVLSTLLYGSKTWILYSHQERRLNVLHMRNLRRLLGTTWQVRVTNATRRLVPGRHAKHVCRPHSETPALAGTRVQDRRRPHPKGHPVRRAFLRNTDNRPTRPALQRHMQEGPEGMWHQPSTTRVRDIRPLQLEINSEGRSQIVGGEKRETVHGKKNELASGRG